MNALPHIPGENWKEIPGYNYLISDHGRVYSKFRNRLKRLGWHPFGYSMVNLSKDGEYKTFTVHTIEMKVFKGLPENPDWVVMHMDDNPKNNLLSNLKYGTQGENIRDSWKRERHTKHVENRKRFGTVQMPAKIVYLIGRDGNKEIRFDNAGTAAQALGICKRSIANVCIGKRNRAGGLVFSY